MEAKKAMKNESREPLTRMNRRTMLGTTTALIGGAIASAAASPIAQEKPGAAAASAAGPNLAPPVVQVKGGKLRGLREGKTSSFLGIPYAEADRFELPKPAAAWTGVKNAQAWGPVCPSPEQTTVSSDELVFPHRYWVENEHCQYLNVWTQNLTPDREEAGHGVDAWRRVHERLVDGVVRVRRPQPQRVRRRRGRQRQSPAEYSRDARPFRLRSAVREVPLHRHR